MAKATRPCPRIGDECWFVKWTVTLGLADDEHPEYGGDPDRDVERTRRAKDRDDALRIAAEVYPEDQYGAVRLWGAEFVPYDEDDADLYPGVGYWSETTDVEHYEGPDA